MAIQGPAWDNSTEYPSFDSDLYRQDSEKVRALTQQIRERIAKQTSLLQQPEIMPANEQSWVRELQEISVLRQEASTLGFNLMTYANLEGSIDAKDPRARKELTRVQDLMSDLEAAYLPVGLYLKRCPHALVEKYLQHAVTRSEAFWLKEGRRFEIYSLSTAEEVTLTQFYNHGPAAWGNLYNQISGAVQVEMPAGKIGLAQANGLLRSNRESERREAWEAIQKAWKPQEESISAILNNLAGWRLEEYRKRGEAARARSPEVQMDFLSFPLRDSRIERSSLTAMMNAVAARSDLSAKAMNLMAKSLGKKKIDPWDILAPAPQKGDSTYPFEEAIALIRKTYSSLHPEMADFLDLMVKNKWIDGRVLPNKRTGAFCAGFKKSRAPRVFQTYMGSLQDVSTLAHELGHAFHNWVMRDLPLPETRYPMTLAETASIFSETALADEMGKTGRDSVRFEVAWADVSDALIFLANIPARFEFEKNFYEQRKSGPLTPTELNQLTDKAWRKFYGEHLSKTEEQFWMTKLHFSIAGVSFYNFPYTFGYLFSLAVYSMREEWGAEFYPRYCALLRDTGRMTAEEVARRHLGCELSSEEFWEKSLTIVEAKIQSFEKLV